MESSDMYVLLCFLNALLVKEGKKFGNHVWKERFRGLKDHAWFKDPYEMWRVLGLCQRGFSFHELLKTEEDKFWQRTRREGLKNDSKMWNILLKTILALYESLSIECNLREVRKLIFALMEQNTLSSFTSESAKDAMFLIVGLLVVESDFEETVKGIQNLNLEEMVRILQYAVLNRIFPNFKMLFKGILTKPKTPKLYQKISRGNAQKSDKIKTIEIMTSTEGDTTFRSIDEKSTLKHQLSLAKRIELQQQEKIKSLADLNQEIRNEKEILESQLKQADLWKSEADKYRKKCHKLMEYKSEKLKLMSKLEKMETETKIQLQEKDNLYHLCSRKLKKSESLLNKLQSDLTNQKRRNDNISEENLQLKTELEEANINLQMVNGMASYTKPGWWLDSIDSVDFIGQSYEHEIENSVNDQIYKQFQKNGDESFRNTKKLIEQLMKIVES